RTALRYPPPVPAEISLPSAEPALWFRDSRRAGAVLTQPVLCFLLETRSQNTEKLSVDRAAAVLLNFLQQARDGADENPDEVYFQELPVWKRAYF
uniref:Uncharacterized protein n=1 Tax=Oryzias sinensis TaxID=183150 RepID=A0A8C7YFU2_9TELE